MATTGDRDVDLFDILLVNGSAGAGETVACLTCTGVTFAGSMDEALAIIASQPDKNWKLVGNINNRIIKPPTRG